MGFVAEFAVLCHTGLLVWDSPAVLAGGTRYRKARWKGIREQASSRGAAVSSAMSLHPSHLQLYRTIVHLTWEVALELVVDSSVLIAVLTGEPARDRLIARTQGAELVAPGSVHWEIGNAFSALLRRRRLRLPEVQAALSAYAQIPIRFVEVELGAAMELADRFGLYAYDAYLIACARRQRSPLVTLDTRLGRTARESGVELLEIG